MSDGSLSAIGHNLSGECKALGIAGLGKMGGNIALKLLESGFQITGFDADPTAVENIEKAGGSKASSLDELVADLPKPRILWLMLPALDATGLTISRLVNILDAGDVIIDGGNSYYKESRSRASEAADRGVFLLDCGTSGGIWGRQFGYCLMIGGDERAFHTVKHVFEALTPPEGPGPLYAGESGAGHFVKMIHNGIEYGMMQAYAEGFEILASKSDLVSSLDSVAEAWRHGSVIRSWLLDLTAEALKADPRLEKLEPFVEDSGEGRWTVQETLELETPAPVITAALQARFASRRENSFGLRLLAAMRKGFGGHSIRTR